MGCSLILLRKGRLEMCAFSSTVIWRCIAGLSLAMMMATPALAQEQATEIHAVTMAAPPFVMKQGDELTGFCIDLWNEVAARLNLKTTYQVAPGVSALLDPMQAKNADVIVAPIFYSTERDQIFDFSHPILEAGMQVLVRGVGEGDQSTPLRDVLNLLFSRSAVIWLGVGLIIILIPAHLLWLLDRGGEDGVSPSRSYFPGILQAMVWSATALVSQVQLLPGYWLARLLGLLWMFAGVVFIALYTAQLTATLTTQQIRGAINGPSDLPGKRVATIAGSTAMTYLQDIGAQVQQFQTADDLLAALMDQKVDAVFANAPALRYFASHDGAGRASVVGPEINRQDIGFVFQLNSPLRRRVNHELLAMREDGTYQRIYEKWFGTE
ncbi:MAG: transporter substrate-binding domain-containing protein [Bradyrhizobium sp.]